MGTWDHHCPNCFSEKTDGKQQCQFCGYDEGESRSPAALPARTILNNQYVVGRILGNPGGFGITYLCWDTMLRTRVAIKEFMPRDNAVRDRDRCSVVAHSGKDREFFEYGLKAFLAEAQTVAGFDHPNIVRVKTYLEQNHTAYMVMDYYEGASLAEYVRQKDGRLPEKAALGIMRFILDGLQHVHNSGYLHRDVKPANIYLTRKGQVILLDFGAARYAMGEHSRSLSVVVTPGFSPFEQYSTKGKQGPWTDIYASGATLYYMLTGNPPESAPDRVLSDTLADPVQLLPDLPPGVNKGIMRALRVKASDRPQNIEELKKILSGSPPLDPPPPPPPPPIPIWRNKKAIAIGICLLVLLAIVYGDWGQLEKVSSGKHVVPVKQSDYVPPEKTVEIVVDRETPVAIKGQKIGDVWNDPVTEMEFVWVPMGCYWMGQTETEKKTLLADVGKEDYEKYLAHEGPSHEVCLDGFWMGKTEVTRGQFKKFVEATGYKTEAEKEGWSWSWSASDGGKWEKKEGINWRNPGISQDDRHPVVCVSWNDTQKMVTWISQKGNGKFLLPSEAQWEYACRGGTQSIRFWGNDPDEACIYANVADQAGKKTFNWAPIHECDDGYDYTSPVGRFKPNKFELYDILGNVWEWCEDVYIADIYSRSDKKNPICNSGGPHRVIRGGSWRNGPDYVRCAHRNYNVPSYRYSYVGFRLLRMP